TDEQDLGALAVATPLGDQVAGAVPRRAVHPARGEAEALEGRCQHVRHRPDAGMIVGAAVDVDRALDERDGVRRPGIDGLDNATFGRREVLRWRCPGSGEEERQGEDMWAHWLL